MSLSVSLYSDLLVRCISNAIYEDDISLLEKRSSGQTVPVSDKARQLGLDWPSRAHSMAGIARLNNLKDLVQRVIDENIAGDLIETGVWRGGSCILMKGILTVNGDTTRTVYVADSFEGLPHANTELYPLDEPFDFLATCSELAIPESVVRRNFSAYGLLDDRVVFVKGFFSETLHRLSAERFALIRLDGDLYESTMDALRALYPKVSPGGFVIVDDYHVVPACKQAVQDYLAERKLAVEIHEIDDSGVWWRVPSGAL